MMVEPCTQSNISDLSFITVKKLAELSGYSVGAIRKKIHDKIWTLGEVAASLNISSRTLIRKLAAEGVRFQSVRDEWCKKQAANYFADGSLSVESVGYLMGFNDVSSFRRSFKRWFGETPSQYISRVREV